MVGDLVRNIMFYSYDILFKTDLSFLKFSSVIPEYLVISENLYALYNKCTLERVQMYRFKSSFTLFEMYRYMTYSHKMVIKTEPHQSAH